MNERTVSQGIYNRKKSIFALNIQNSALKKRLNIFHRKFGMDFVLNIKEY